MGMQGRFIDGADRRILLVSHEPETNCKHAVVVFPALAEEMNKSRRLLWSLGQALVQSGVMLVIPDLSCTGDSEGEFVDARWSAWRDDMKATLAWVSEQNVSRVDALLVRFGACLFTDCVASFSAESRILAWAPEYSGEKALKQALRLKVMSDRVTWGEKSKLADLEAILADSPVEIGGYQYHPELARALSAATFEPMSLPSPERLAVLDWTRAGAEEEPVAYQRLTAAGQKFWTAVEPDDNPALIADSARWLVEGA